MTTTRLSPLDTAFLAVETPTAHMHVGWAAIYDPPADGPRPGFDELRDHIGSRLSRAPRYRQLLRPVPLGVNTPVWVDDEEFDLSRHVVPAHSERLDEVVADCMSEPPPSEGGEWTPRPAPGAVGLLADGVVDAARGALRTATLPVRVARSPRRL